MAVFELGWDDSWLYKYTGKSAKVAIPDSVRSIRGFNNANVKNVVIPEGVQSVDCGAFVGCKSLESFLVAETNQVLRSDGRSIYNADTLIAYAANSGTSYAVPEGVTSVGAQSFEGCNQLAEVVIPEGVEAIGDKAFSGCEKLAKVSLPSTLKQIGTEAFKGCKSLSRVVIGESVEKIGRDAFDGCHSLTSVKICCPSLRLWLKRNYALAIGRHYELFIAGEPLVNATMDTVFNAHALDHCVALESVTITERVNELNGTSYGDDYAFRDCPNLKSVSIHASSWDSWLNRADSVARYIEEYDLYIDGWKHTTLAISSGNRDLINGPGWRAASAFRGVKSATKLIVPSSYEGPLGRLVAGSRIESVELSPGNVFKSLADGVVFTADGDLDVYPAGKSGNEYVVPADTRSVLYRAFCNPAELRTVTVSGTKTELREGAFTSNKRLKVVLHPDTEVFPGEKSGSPFVGNVIVECANPDIFFKPDAREDRYFQGLAIIVPQISIDALPAKLKRPAALGYMIHVAQGGAVSTDVDAAYLKYVKSQKKKLYPEMIILPEVADYLINEALIVKKDIPDVVAMAETVRSDELVKRLEDYASNPKKKDGWRATAGATAAKVVEVEPYVLERLALRGPVAKKIETAVKKGVLLADCQGECSPDALKLCLDSIKVDGCNMSKVRRKNEYLKVKYGPEVEEICSWLDMDHLQESLDALYFDKGLRAALPLLCLVATGEYLDKVLTIAKRVGGWSTAECEDIRIARGALMHNDDEGLMVFANNMGLLDEYARIRKTTADNLRDTYLSDFGFDSSGCIFYDLGDRSLKVTISNDLKLSMFDEAAGKEVKSVPKKGSDPTKYEKAKTDISQLKKAIRNIVTQRKKLLFDDYLSGRSRKAFDWKKSYLENPVLKSVARLLVWQQGNTSFTVGADGPIDSLGNSVKLGGGAIAVAHVSELNASDIDAWRKYFASNGLKQPFEQVWEYAIDFDSIKEDRYAGRPIPFYRFRGREKHGITVYDENFHNDIDIVFDDCYADVVRLDWGRHHIENSHRFEIKSFSVARRSRMANHVVTYLDRLSVYGRIINNDLGVMDYVRSSNASLADVLKYIDVAAENSATELAALLMEYRDEHFAEYAGIDSLLLD